MSMFTFAKRVIDDSITGPNGTYDPVRILFAIAGLNGVIAPVAFQTWAMATKGDWDVTAFCLAYGGMIAAIVSSGGIAMNVKDKGLAQASATISETSRKDAAAQ